MDLETLGRVAGRFGWILGGLLGLVAGIVFTSLSIENTKGPRERAFVIRASILGWVSVAIFGLSIWLAPKTYQFELIEVLLGVLALAGFVLKKRQMAVRAEESQPNP